MTLPDMEMARGSSEGFNLAIGEPVIVRNRCSGHFYAYPPADGMSDLKTQVARFVLSQYKIEGFPVITNGAKQAIAAIMYAYKKRGYAFVYHKAPYWPSYPTLAKTVGLQFTTTESAYGTVSFNTSPNNPDGEISTKPCHVWDAVYASEFYGWNGEVPDCNAVVGSMSKTFGMPGLRVGWVVCKDRALAADCAEYVEITTSGVSTESQWLAQSRIQGWLDYGSYGVDAIRDGFRANGETFNAVIAPYCSEVYGVPASGLGMFAWFRVSASHEQDFKSRIAKAKIQLVSGASCGKRGWYRMNLAVSPSTLRNALKEFQSE